MLMLLLSLMWVHGWSQADTLVMRSGQRVGVKVEEIEQTPLDGTLVRLKEWVVFDGRTFDRVSLNGVSAIKFADGICPSILRIVMD